MIDGIDPKDIVKVAPSEYQTYYLIGDPLPHRVLIRLGYIEIFSEEEIAKIEKGLNHGSADQKAT